MQFFEFVDFTKPTKNITVFENLNAIFPSTQRVYVFHSMDRNFLSGNHAHKELEQIVLPIYGSFKISLDNGLEKETIYLSSDAAKGVKIFAGVWRVLSEFSPNCVVLVLASENFDEDDYIRDYKQFLHWKDGNLT